LDTAALNGSSSATDTFSNDASVYAGYEAQSFDASTELNDSVSYGQSPLNGSEEPPVAAVVENRGGWTQTRWSSHGPLAKLAFDPTAGANRRELQSASVDSGVLY
jgi:hypothetical protein